MTDFILLPAIDIADGRAVRPHRPSGFVGMPTKEDNGHPPDPSTHGLPDSGATSGQPAAASAGAGDNTDSPAELARTYIRDGANWLHVVDLDRARATGSNDEVMATTIAATKSEWAAVTHPQRERIPAQLMVQVSGGIRDANDVERAFALGADWVNLACEVVLDQRLLADFADKYGERISVSLDIDSDGVQLLARGTGIACGTFSAGLTALKVAGIKRVIITDTRADGAMTGPGIRSLELAMAAGIQVIASGGISSIADLTLLAAMQQRGLRGAIAGTALAAGAFTVADALQVIRDI